MRWKLARPLAPAVILSGLFACGSENPPSTDGHTFGEPLDDEGRAALRSELEEARSRWRQANVTAYRIDVVRGGLAAERHRLQVEGDSITSAVRVLEDGEPDVLIPRDSSNYGVPEDSIYSMLSISISADSLYSVLVSRLPTVLHLFRILDSAIDSAFSMSVEYDPDLGYPRSLMIDHSSTSLDEESIYSVQELEVIQGRRSR